MGRRPRIAITMRLEISTNRFYLGRHYSEAVEAAGGVPVHIPLIPKESFISAVLAGADGLLLPGSDSDVDPLFYGEEPRHGIGRIVPEKDATEMAVLHEAERRDLPILAICYGMQALNVSRGGSLIQDLERSDPGGIDHQQGLPLDRRSHAITIENDSLLFGLAGGFELGKDPRVNSHHHQAVKTVGRDLVATAWAKDGVIECIEDTRSDKHVIGVQWHPELDWDKDPLSLRLFEWLISVSAERRIRQEDVISSDRKMLSDVR